MANKQPQDVVRNALMIARITTGELPSTRKFVSSAGLSGLEFGSAGVVVRNRNLSQNI